MIRLRTGYDVLAALALGARTVFVGRPVLWALACGGAEGVRTLLSDLASGFAHAMTLAGAATVADLEGVAGTAPRQVPRARSRPTARLPGVGQGAAQGIAWGNEDRAPGRQPQRPCRYAGAAPDV